MGSITRPGHHPAKNPRRRHGSIRAAHPLDHLLGDEAHTARPALGCCVQHIVHLQCRWVHSERTHSKQRNLLRGAPWSADRVQTPGPWRLQSPLSFASHLVQQCSWLWVTHGSNPVTASITCHAPQRGKDIITFTRCGNFAAIPSSSSFRRTSSAVRLPKMSDSCTTAHTPC